jgi:hypothetical protein
MSLSQADLAVPKKNPAADFHFIADINTAGKYISSLQCPGDRFGTEFIQPVQQLGDVQVRYRTGTGSWQVCSTRDPVTASTKLKVTSRYEMHKDKLAWHIQLDNVSGYKIEAGDIRIPLPMNSVYSHDPEETFTRRVFRHSFISGHGSFLFWLPVGGEGTFLVMLPDSDTHLEYFTSLGHEYAWGKGEYAVFIHSKASGEATPGTWRQPHTSLVLKPGEKKLYGFTFFRADSCQGVRDVLYEHGGCDVHVAPGMVVPERLPVKLALRTKNTIVSITPEYPDETHITACNPAGTNLQTWTIVFSRPAENKLTVEFDGNRYMLLEFFVTQPIETLIKKRAAFIAGKQQHRDPEKWYNGLFSLWDVRLPDGKNLLGPDNLGGQHPYAVSGSDDPSNSKCIYLSEKNVVYPDKKEIEALEYFLKNFVWGKHQRPDKEKPFAYGIYGSDSWHANRFASRDPLTNGISRPGGPSQSRMWRTFDYTTYFAVYFNMYRIAKLNPHLVKYLDANGYLERAYGTARAFFEVPYTIRMEGGWSFNGWTDWAYKLGNFHEKYLLPLIAALEEVGKQDRADWLRGEWEKKVKYFLYDDPYPWVSEMPVDSTAYESTYAIAKYGIMHELKPDTNLWYDKNLEKWYSHPEIDKQKHREFLRRQLLANLACRGWLTPAYYYLGSDFRGLGSTGYTLSYMSQMGGWSILDQAVCFEKRPADLIRLGSAAMLSSWALVNAGKAENNYGYWYPGKQHDGAAGWGFLPQKHGSEWNPSCKSIPRGPWPVDGEIDHGLSAGIESAATIVIDDPLFGWYAYCGELQQTNSMLQVIPRDGVRQRLHVISGKQRLHLMLDADGFKRNMFLEIMPDLSRIAFTLENRIGEQHTANLAAKGLPKGTYQVLVNGKKLTRFTSFPSKKISIPLVLKKQPEIHVTIRRSL